ncbi:hypothetical protein [Elizabethkingia anophelis]|uniref:hypothetical protein n=1 Tax=Elizabethkingia anophelis TaxID=1117645 RepID=UPI0021A396F9|nr:hypothetical protein [Elizabethkingia anophelis]MCT3780932.1 hypothetical protein [Elizabethkingia anophelis]
MSSHNIRGKYKSKEDIEEILLLWGGYVLSDTSVFCLTSQLLSLIRYWFRVFPDQVQSWGLRKKLS